jgi:hypothetical protein
MKVTVYLERGSNVETQHDCVDVDMAGVTVYRSAKDRANRAIAGGFTVRRCFPWHAVSEVQWHATAEEES